MEEIIQIQDALGIGSEPLNLITTIFNLGFCIVMSFVIRSFYVRHSFSLTGKNHIGSVLPILSCVVFLIIVVVKSSLALSLGLVGALSIVRFRTPIKEPEELVYLFLAIAVGLGYGAGFTLVTTLIVSIILIIIYLFLVKRKVHNTNEYTVVIDWKIKGGKGLHEIIESLNEGCETVKLIRLDSGDEQQTGVLLVTPLEEINIDDLIKNLKSNNKGLTVSFFESKRNW